MLVIKCHNVCDACWQNSGAYTIYSIRIQYLHQFYTKINQTKLQNNNRNGMHVQAPLDNVHFHDDDDDIYL